MFEDALEIPPYLRGAMQEKLAFARLVRAAQGIQGLATRKQIQEFRRALKAAAKYFPLQRGSQP